MSDVTSQGTVDPSAGTPLAALTSTPDRPGNLNTALSYRSVATHLQTAENLGPLADLPGWWEGTGFSIIARPDDDPGNPDGFFLQLNALRETIEFRSIGSPVPNRGSVQADAYLYGVTYLHRVTDAVTGSALHIEPGLWLTMPADDATPPTTIARLSTVPHGNAVTATGFFEAVVPDGPPEIPYASTVPYPVDRQPPAPGTPNPYPVYDLATPSPHRTSPLPDAITQALVDDPHQFVRDTLAALDVRHITRLVTSTDPGGGITNIPFIERNADARHLESVFAILRVQDDQDTEVLRLLYSQTALLAFRGQVFPHITVGSLTKAF